MNDSVSLPTFPVIPKENDNSETSDNSDDNEELKIKKSNTEATKIEFSTISETKEAPKKRTLNPTVVKPQSKSSLSVLSKADLKKKRTTSSLSSVSSSMANSPFRIPNDSEIFALRDQQRREKQEYQASLKGTHCYLQGTGLEDDKTPSSLSLKRRSNFRYMTQLPPPKVSAEHEALSQLILSQDAHQTQEGLRDFIEQKRDIFLAQLSIETKREELKRLERIELEESDNLKKREAEIQLFKDQFRSFLESDGKLTMEKRLEAEQKAKQRLEVTLKIKQVSSEISSLRNAIAHDEEKLKECDEYKEFLEKLTPADWRAKHPFPELFYKEPHQLVEILQHLENQNMFLIHHCQDAEEAVERIKAKFTKLLNERDSEINQMNIRKMEQNNKVDQMKKKIESFNYQGKFHHINELPQEELDELVAAITEFHNKLGFDEAATGDTSTMLKRIENKMEELNRKLEMVDQKLVKEMALEKARKRRDLERTEKAEKKQREQEEKTLKALQLATMPIKKKTGRPVLQRSLPFRDESREKREEKMRLEQAQREADQNLLFGEIWD